MNKFNFQKVILALVSGSLMFISMASHAEIISANENKYIRFTAFQDNYLQVQVCDFQVVTVPGYGDKKFRKTTLCKDIGSQKYYLISDIINARRLEALKIFGKGAGIIAGAALGTAVGIGLLIVVHPLAAAGYVSLGTASVAVGGGALGGGATSAVVINPAENYRLWQSYGEKALYGQLVVKSVSKYEELIRSNLNH